MSALWSPTPIPSRPLGKRCLPSSPGRRFARSWRSDMALVEHPHISLFGTTECSCTEEEAKALALVAAYRVAKVSDRAPFLAPGFKRHRAGFHHVGELWEHRGPGGMDDDSMRDRLNVLLDLTAKNDKVWGIFRVVGTHTGS